MSALTGGAKNTLQAKPYCIVEGEIAARTGADGKHYGIKLQLRLPENWNSKFLFQGGGGNGLDDFDPLSALEQWHDNNQAPNSLVAKSKTYPNKQMPICAYPKVATYIGEDENKAESFECR
ncbi:tannase/feruloyl esterase family alpha/beta hydrolase [Rodentibacter abscessus]|uniref:tannase/feruloyl esterase family alpha/beta hydrolase n=1 Tax=Rodentibacter abscessus TaxID=3381777 RepID=UPI00399CD037